MILDTAVQIYGLYIFIAVCILFSACPGPIYRRGQVAITAYYTSMPAVPMLVLPGYPLLSHTSKVIFLTLGYVWITAWLVYFFRTDHEIVVFGDRKPPQDFKDSTNSDE